MIEVATAINSFGIPSPKADFVPPAEEPIFVLTGSQLRDLVSRGIEEAIRPLLDEVRQLQAAVACQDEKIVALEATELQDVDRLARNIALDRQRLAKLERVEPQPLQRDRGEILRALLAANSGKMLAKNARQKMRMSKQAFTNLLAVVDGVKSRSYRNDKRQRLLVLE
jgi:crotonobetainyl-CoA:carnitine CoA-transferase CaiB-like acyl-CoA transferase